MSTIALQHNIGAFIALVTSVAPQAATANVNGGAIDRFAHNLPLSCVLHSAVGAVTGSPTAISAAAKLQHSSDGTTWADYIAPGNATVSTTAALTAANGENVVAIDLSSAARYIRAVEVITLTGGSSPTIQVMADIVLGGEQLRPAA